MDFNILLVPVFLPMAVGILILFLPKKLPALAELLSLVSAGAGLLAAVTIFLAPPADLSLFSWRVYGFILEISFRLTPLGSSLLLFAYGFGFLILLFSLPYLASRPKTATPPRARQEYYGFYLLALGAGSAVFLADNFIMFLIFWEIVTASLYFLINTGTEEARAGATKSFALLGVADGCLLLGIGIVFYLSHTFTISALRLPVNGALAVLGFLLMMLGAITKAGSMPLHTWIPAASQGASAPVMAFLPAALDKLLGIYLLYLLCTRVFALTAALGTVLMIIGIFTLISAVMLAMVQRDLPKLLAYNTISQVGYMLLGLGTLNPLGMAGALFHMLNHALYESCLFLCGAAVEKQTGERDLGKLGGLAGTMPVTFICCLIASLAISGVPFFNGFVSKWMVYQGVIARGLTSGFVFLVAAMFGSALTLSVFIKVLYALFLGPKTEVTRKVKKEAPLVMLIPLLVLASLCLFFGIFYTLPLDTFIYPGMGIGRLSSGLWDSSLAVILLLVGLGLGLLFLYLGRVTKTARLVKPFIGGEPADKSGSRFSAVRFFDSIKALKGLSTLYNSQEKGYFDPYVLFGGLGHAVTRVFQKIHNGYLANYLSWSLAALVLLLFISLGLL